MKEIRPKIFIIAFMLLFFSLSTSGQSSTLYHCVNSQGSIMLTDNPPTNPDYKCTFGTSYKDLTPQERAKEQREMEAYRQQIRAANAKHDAEKRAEVARQEEANRRSNQEEASRRANQRSSSQGSSAEMRNKESELRSVLGRMPTGSASFDDTAKWALEAARIKGEMNRLQRQDPNYQPDPNAKLRDSEFELQQQKSDSEYELRRQKSNFEWEKSKLEQEKSKLEREKMNRSLGIY